MKTIILLLSLFTFTSCENDSNITADKLYSAIDTIQTFDERGIRTVHTYIIDSCEYIGYINAYQSDFLTHKSNCKYCLKRNYHE